MSNTAIELNLIVNKYVAELVLKLAAKYGFDFDEAMASLDLKTDPVLAKSSKDNAKISKEDAKKTKEDEKLAKKAAKEAKDLAKADKPKRATTGYLVYSKEMREQVKASLTAKLEGDAKLKPQDIVKELGNMWKSLTAEQQLVWNSKAKASSSSDEELD